MKYALTDRSEPVQEFERPPGIIERSVCWESGLLPTPECGRVVNEIFIQGTEPTQYDTVWRSFEINKDNGKLATVYTPPELRERRVYQIYPPEAADWVREQGIAQPPTEYDQTVAQSTVDPEAAIISPTPYSYIRGAVPITGTAQLDGFANYRIEFGEGVNPASWTQIGSTHGEQVNQGPLEFWDATPYNGLYSLRVVVTRGDGSTKEGVVQVTVDNEAPAVDIIAPVDGQRYVTEDDEWVSITADAADNWAMDRAEFTVDGEQVGTSTVAPYSLRWDIRLRGQPGGGGGQQLPEVNSSGKQTGRFFTVYPSGFGFLSDGDEYIETHLVKVKVYDRAGNETTSEPVRIFIARKPKEKP